MEDSRGLTRECSFNRRTSTYRREMGNKKITTKTNILRGGEKMYAPETEENTSIATTPRMEITNKNGEGIRGQKELRKRDDVLSPGHQ